MVMRYETEQKENQQNSTTEKNANEDDIPDAEDPIWINGLWQAMGWLEGVCHRDHPEHEGAQGIENRLVVPTGSLCARRSCGKKAVSKCSSCKEFWYCGVECQRL